MGCRLASAASNRSVVRNPDRRVAARHSPDRRRTDGVLFYSLSTLSAHSTSTTKSGGVTKRAFLPSRSVSRTARAREHAVQMLNGILRPIVSRIMSDRGGHPTGVTEFIVSFLIKFTASPSKNICTSCPAAEKAFAWRKGKAALVDSSDPQALLIKIFIICDPALQGF